MVVRVKWGLNFPYNDPPKCLMWGKPLQCWSFVYPSLSQFFMASVTSKHFQQINISDTAYNLFKGVGEWPAWFDQAFSGVDMLPVWSWIKYSSLQRTWYMHVVSMYSTYMYPGLCKHHQSLYHGWCSMGCNVLLLLCWISMSYFSLADRPCDLQILFAPL